MLTPMSRAGGLPADKERLMKSPRPSKTVRSMIVLTLLAAGVFLFPTVGDRANAQQQTPGSAKADAVPAEFAERFAETNDVRLHYLIGGSGSPVVLLHGYAQTGLMWRPLMPLLARRHTVIVPDLRGAGGSAKPQSGYDKMKHGRGHSRIDRFAGI